MPERTNQSVARDNMDSLDKPLFYPTGWKYLGRLIDVFAFVKWQCQQGKENQRETFARKDIYGPWPQIRQKRNVRWLCPQVHVVGSKHPIKYPNARRDQIEDNKGPPNRSWAQPGTFSPRDG